VKYDEFGGIVVDDEEQLDEFGGVIVDEAATPDTAPEPTPEPAKPSIMDKALDAGFPLSRSISRSMKPGIGRDLLANAGTALDVLSAPFRAIDAGINEISKPVNKLTGVSGSYEEGKQAIAGMIPGKGVVSNLARTGVDMALSPSSYVPAGAIGKMMRTPVQKVESEMAKQLSMKTPRAAPAAIPQKTEDMTLKEVEKGGGPIEQATGEVIDASKVPQQGLPMLRDLSESERRIMSEPKAPNTIPFSEYAKQSVLKKKNVQAAQPNQLAATNASKAFEEVDMMRKDAGKKLQEVIDANPDAVIDISSAKQEYLQMVNDRIQPMIKGEIAADPSAVKLSEEIGNMLLNLPDQISAKVGVNLKRNLQNRVKYDAEGQLRPVNGRLEGITKATAGSIDGSLDKALKGFKEANEAYGKTSQLRNNMSKVLGKEISETTGLTKHGASIMKRAIESNADSGISELFRQVKEMTGGKYDLFQDASYASIAMKHSGDVRQVQMALPFGGALTAAMGHPTGILDIAKKSGEAIGAIRGGNQLARIDKWHTKQQAKNPGSTVADFAAKKTPVDQSKLSDQVKPGQSVAEFVAESQKKGATPAGKKTGTMADRLRTIGANAARRLGNERGAVGGASNVYDVKRTKDYTTGLSDDEIRRIWGKNPASDYLKTGNTIPKDLTEIEVQEIRSQINRDASANDFSYDKLEKSIERLLPKSEQQTGRSRQLLNEVSGDISNYGVQKTQNVVYERFNELLDKLNSEKRPITRGYIVDDLKDHKILLDALEENSPYQRSEKIRSAGSGGEKLGSLLNKQGERLGKTLGNQRGAIGGAVDIGSADDIAQQLGVRFNGVQLGMNDEPVFMLFTDPKTNSTFAARNAGEAKSRLQQMLSAFGNQRGAVGGASNAGAAHHYETIGAFSKATKRYDNELMGAKELEFPIGQFEDVNLDYDQTYGITNDRYLNYDMAKRQLSQVFTEEEFKKADDAAYNWLAEFAARGKKNINENDIAEVVGYAVPRTAESSTGAHDLLYNEAAKKAVQRALADEKGFERLVKEKVWGNIDSAIPNTGDDPLGWFAPSKKVDPEVIGYYSKLHPEIVREYIDQNRIIGKNVDEVEKIFKSATGNSGAFSAATPDIRGSGAVPMMAGMAAAGVGGATVAAFATAKQRNKKK